MPSANRERAVILAITAILLWTWGAGPEHIAGAVIVAGFLCWYVGKRQHGPATAGALPPPPPVTSDANAREMIRVWIAHEDLHVSLNLGMYASDPDAKVDEREAWGQMLSDTTWHIANGLHQSHGLDPHVSAGMIRDILLEKLADESELDRAQGRYLDDGEAQQP